MTGRRWLWRLLAVTALGVLLAGATLTWNATHSPKAEHGSAPTTGQTSSGQAAGGPASGGRVSGGQASSGQAAGGRASGGSASGGQGAPKTPPSTANRALVDHQPPAGRESTLLPSPDAARGPLLTIPAIGVRAGIVPEGIDQTPGDVGNLSAPEAASQVGWWDGGPTPGQGGVAVLTGHFVDGWAFWKLGELGSGDTIQVTGTNGITTNWTVTSTEQVLKSELPSSVWTEGGPAKLALVTCGGTFNNSIGHYNDNVLVWAKPA